MRRKYYRYWRGGELDWNPKKGDRVFVCYDGKYGRRVVGKIIKRQGSTITVSFDDYIEDDNVITFRANRRRGGDYAGWAIHDGTLMDKLFGSKACAGDWYSVKPYRKDHDVKES